MTPREQLSGIGACLAIIALLAGMPAVLIAVAGNPIPDHLPTVHGLLTVLTTPDDGTVALTALSYAGWLLWLVLAALLLTEIAAQLRGIQSPDVPGLRLPQLAIRQLVAAAAALFLAAPLVLTHPTPGVAAPPRPAAPHTAAPTKPGTASPGKVGPGDARPGRHHKASARPQTHSPTTAEHLVREGDTLSGLAEYYLGDADRWPQIYRASGKFRQPDGRHLSDPNLIVDGWTVRVPHHRPDSTEAEHPTVERQVREGDTLANLAATELGKANRWPEIYRASTHVRQPDGSHLSNPNMIRTGWTLRIPTTPTSSLKRRNTTQTPAPAHPGPEPERHAAANGNPAGNNRADPTPPQWPTPTSPSTSPAASATASTSTDPTPATTSAQSEVPEPTITVPWPDLEAPWILGGLAVGGAVLAGSAYLTLRRRRAQQMRLRNPGHSVPRPEPAVRPVEKTIIAVGSVSADAVRAMDLRLRDLAARQVAADLPMPKVDTVELTDHDIVLHLAAPADLNEPWAHTGDRLTWQAPHAALLSGPIDHADHVDHAEQPEPYPLLVTIGAGDDGHIWLLNLEGLGVLDVGGDRTYGADLLRYIGAELAVNPWSRDVSVACVGVATEVAAMNAERIRTFETASAAAAEMRLDAEATIVRAGEVGTSPVTARAAQLSDEAWTSQVLLLDSDVAADPGMDDLLKLVSRQPERGATVVVVAGGATHVDHRHIDVDDHGRLTVPHLGLDLVSVGLTPDEAKGCALLLNQADSADSSVEAEDAVNDADSSTAWTPPVDDDDVDLDHLMPHEAGEAFSESAMDGLSGQPPTAGPGIAESPSATERVDPDLDADLAAWFAESCDRPRLSLLGPVRVRANGRAIPKRKPYYTELLAYLAYRENGARPDEVAEAFGIALPSVRTSIKIVRDWLGVNPRTGERHLPEATRSRAAIARGIPVYQVDDLLTDVKLFERLRKRATRRGAAGSEDLVSALSLITGRPFDQLRPGGWSWLVDTGIENSTVCAVIDIAHQLVATFLAAGELDRARAAIQAALVAAPTDPTLKLDLASVAKREGHRQEAHRLALDVVRDSESDGLPADLGWPLGARVKALLDDTTNPSRREAS